VGYIARFNRVSVTKRLMSNQEVEVCELLPSMRRSTMGLARGCAILPRGCHVAPPSVLATTPAHRQGH